MGSKPSTTASPIQLNIIHKIFQHVKIKNLREYLTHLVAELPH